MRLTKNVGMILLAIWLILWGLMAAVAGFALPPVLMAVARYRGRGFNPAGPVSGSVSRPTALMSDGNWQRALYDLPTPAWLGIQDSYYSAVIPAQAGMMERGAQCDG